MDENYIYPLTTYDQVILPDGSRWTGKALENGGSINGNLNINGVVEAQSFVENGVFLASKYAQVATYNVILDKLDNGKYMSLEKVDELLEYEDAVLLFMSSKDIYLLQQEYEKKLKEKYQMI